MTAILFKDVGRKELFTLTGTFGRERLRNSQLWFAPGYRPINGKSIRIMGGAMHKIESHSITTGHSFGKSSQTSESNASFAGALEQAQRDADRFQIKKFTPALSSAEQELQEFLSMSLEERFFEMTLRSLGISKEEYAAMSPAEKEEVARMVQQSIAERMKDNASNGRASALELG